MSKLNKRVFWKVAVSAGLAFGAVVLLVNVLSGQEVNSSILFIVSLGAGFLYAYINGGKHIRCLDENSTNA